MNGETKEQIITILMALYKISGQWFILGIISFGIAEIMLKNDNFGGIIFFLFGIFFFGLEIISPIIAGRELYEKFFL